MHLGIVPTYNGTHHDPSACLVDQGEIVAFVEQERMSRTKHAAGEFPVDAIEECLSITNSNFSDIDSISLSRNYKNRKKVFWRVVRRGIRSTNTSFAERAYDTIVLPPKKRYLFTNSNLVTIVKKKISRHFGISEDTLPSVTCIDHHRTHAASAFYPSGFDDALVVSVDNYGGHLSTAIYEGNGTDLTLIKSFPRFNSLGRFFSDITSYLGFRRSNGEGKVMGLAPYGGDNENVKNVLSNYAEYSNGDYNVEELTYRKMDDAVRKLESDLGVSSRYWKDPITQFHKDVAYHAQKTIEDILRHVVGHYISHINTSNVCLAGGVALNCKMNKRIRELPDVDNIFVQPSANDAGGSIGAACEHAVQSGDEIFELNNMYLGSSFTNKQIKNTLDTLKIPYTTLEDVTGTTAELLRDGALVGWFQGQMEGGPRALGNRSIIADPRTTASRDKVNKYVKHREEWRPFAPSMLQIDAEQYLVGKHSKAAQFMIDTYETTPEAVKEIPAVLHPADHTTRPQIVTKESNERYYDLLTEFKDRTGIGVVLNTSFNDSGEPIVRTPHEAVRDFYSMGLDNLIMNDIMVSK